MADEDVFLDDSEVFLDTLNEVWLDPVVVGGIVVEDKSPMGLLLGVLP